MAGSVFDSPLMTRLFDAGDVKRLFSDTAEIRAMLLVEGVLARVQARHGIIPEDSAGAISRASMEIQIDPGALARATGENGVSVPALVAAFRDEMKAPEHAQYVHWGATSQDIMDTGLMLRLRQALTLVETALHDTLAALAKLAEAHARTPLPARTYGQHATPTSFGAVVSTWGHPLLDLCRDLPALRRSSLLVSLSGAAGTASQLGPDPALLRRDLAEMLDLEDPVRTWHVERAPLLKLADWFNRVTLAVGKIGEDTTEMAQTGIEEIRFAATGASSTMPQKQNPVGPSLLVALARQGVALNSALQGAAMPRYQRDGASWFVEWMCLPQIVLGSATAAKRAPDLIRGLSVQPEQMRAALDLHGGMIHAEALSFALSVEMSRPDAQAAVKRLCAEALQAQIPLLDLVRRDFPALDHATLFDPDHNMGSAPQDALDFASQVKTHLKDAA